MIGDAYLGTLFRLVCVATLVASAMMLLHRLLRRLRCRDETSAGYAFILPWLTGLVVFSLLPMAWSFYLSFTRYGVLSGPQWVGARNYAAIFSPDPIFVSAAVNTAAFAALSVGLGITASLAAALLLSLRARGMGIWRAVYYVPSVIPAVSTALLWRWIFVPEGGLANGLLRVAGLPQPGWFHDPRWVIPAFVIMGLQGACGNNMVIFLARLRGIDAQLHQAAALDGAGVWARFVHITLPQLSPVVFYHLVPGLIGGLLLFTQPMFIRTPGRSGLFYVPYVYRTGWEQLRMGYAAALSWVLFAALGVLTAIVVLTSRKWVSYEESEVQLIEPSQALGPAGWRRRLWYGVVVAGGLAMLVPLLWMVSTSLRESEDLFAIPPKLLPWPVRPENYANAWRAAPFWRFLFNTLFVAVLATAGQTLSAALTAYGFARFRFPGRGALFGVLLGTLLLPGIVLIVPVFLLWRAFGLVGTFDPLVLGSLLGGGALQVFIFRQFFRTLPSELEEAARLDGASHARVFFRMILPLSWPAALVVVLITFQAHWNDFLGPLLYLNDEAHYTMTIGLRYFEGKFMGEAPKWHWMMAVTTLMAIPTVLIFLVAQRSFMRHVARAGPRGAPA